MSLQPSSPVEVPGQTAAVARAAFPRGNPYMRLRDELGTVFTDAQFTALFSSRGRPAEAPWRLALVTVLQFSENLSDRRAAEAARGRIDWKYLLSLDLTDPGFDASVLSEFRSRLVAGHAETLLTLCRERRLLVARGRQRTDSTHVLGAVRSLNRLGCVTETLRAALNALTVAAPEWLRPTPRRLGASVTPSPPTICTSRRARQPVGLMPNRSAATDTLSWRPCSRPTPRPGSARSRP